MSDEIFCIRFNGGVLRLDVLFNEDDYEKASVRFKLVGPNGLLEESGSIPVRTLFDISFLIGMCIRRTAAQYEKEVQEMMDRIEQKKHPFKHIGGANEENKKATK